MKVYISADIEGIVGTTNWDEATRSHADFSQFQQQMTAEVAAACRGALKAGATEILVKDAHDGARNILADQLPTEARLWRGWSGHPYEMMEGLDGSFQAAMMIGYHSRAGSSANPLAHTMSLRDSYVKINDRFAAEFLMNAYTAALEKVPVVFVSGDAGLCEDAASFIPAITGVAVKEGLGSSALSLHPKVAVQRIAEGVEKALKGDLTRCLVPLPRHFSVEIGYRDHFKAYAMSFFPGAKLKDSHTITFESDDYFEVLKLFLFVF